VSQYVERPSVAKHNHPVVSQFIRSDIEQILSLKPDLVIGFSDIQKDIARELIGLGISVFVTNQRSLAQILDQMLLLGRMIGEEDKALKLVQDFSRRLELAREKSKHQPKVRVYFEEWDRPRLSAIQWVSELMEATGGVNLFSHKTGSLAAQREVFDEEIIQLNPDVIIGCWCGKKVQVEAICQRPGYGAIKAVQKNQVYEVDPSIFLQPGPALFVDGISQMLELFEKLASNLDA
jgi:iron complex transport system substrate-binding protein